MAKPTTPSSTATNGSGGMSRSQHTQAQTIRNKRLLEENDPPSGSETTTSCAARRRPELARKFLLRTSLFESLREAEQIN